MMAMWFTLRMRSPMPCRGSSGFQWRWDSGDWDALGDGICIFFRKRTKNITRPTKALQVMRTAAAGTGKASKSPTPAPVKAPHTKTATKIRRHNSMMGFTALEFWKVHDYTAKHLKSVNACKCVVFKCIWCRLCDVAIWKFKNCSKTWKHKPKQLSLELLGHSLRQPLNQDQARVKLFTTSSLFGWFHLHSWIVFKSSDCRKCIYVQRVYVQTGVYVSNSVIFEKSFFLFQDFETHQSPYSRLSLSVKSVSHVPIIQRCCSNLWEIWLFQCVPIPIIVHWNRLPDFPSTVPKTPFLAARRVIGAFRSSRLVRELGPVELGPRKTSPEKESAKHQAKNHS